MSAERSFMLSLEIALSSIGSAVLGSAFGSGKGGPFPAI